MPKRLFPVLVTAAVLGIAGAAGAQVDPEPRANLELGVEGPLRGAGPLSGYGFFLWNLPNFPADDLYLTKEVTLMLGYGYGLDAPRNGGFGGHEAHTLLELKF